MFASLLSNRSILHDTYPPPSSGALYISYQYRSSNLGFSLKTPSKNRRHNNRIPQAVADMSLQHQDFKNQHASDFSRMQHASNMTDNKEEKRRKEQRHRKLSFHQVFLVSEVELNIYIEIDDFDGSLILMAAGDTFRAAPSDQLGIWAERTGCKIVLAEKEKAKASSGR
ncbi:hypothetical protein L2E82_21501 [Cichorium intybus]|uniref:Uncharacterized protein n=1 Tax=Cichorium intybus TaxID=13427 RepID=A0ACB9DWV9_CICIN|nr:hypothetical protein L2E82_21501 [Cichorium intybus]